MDLIFEIIFGALFELFKLICPNYKFKKWQKALLITLSVILLLTSLGCFIVGIHFLSSGEGSRTLAITLTAVGASLLGIQIVTFFVLAGLKLKQDAGKNR